MPESAPLIHVGGGSGTTLESMKATAEGKKRIAMSASALERADVTGIGWQTGLIAIVLCESWTAATGNRKIDSIKIEEAAITGA
jgi:hypothetical protein